MKKEEKQEGNQQQIKLYVDRNQSPIRIDKFVMDHLEKVSRSRIQNAIKEGLLLVNAKEIKANYKVRPLDVITVFLNCLLYTSPSPRDATLSRMPSSA